MSARDQAKLSDKNIKHWWVITDHKHNNFSKIIKRINFLLTHLLCCKCTQMHWDEGSNTIVRTKNLSN